MKAIVIKAYKDKDTLKVTKIGQAVEVTKERFKEINKNEIFLLDLEEICQKVEEVVRITGNYDNYKVDELKKELELRGIPYEDEKKAELIEILKIDDTDK